MAEQRLDIHELFCYYNSIYFNEALCTCIVSWAPCLTSMAAHCDFIEGLCEIQLSEPLLKSRSSDDIKNILLHEMIHAFLWIIHKNGNHSDHGSQFWNLANLINSNDKYDDQRPTKGYSITANHCFPDEDIGNAHLWMCNSCGDLIKKGMNGVPSPTGCIEKNDGDECANLLCGWHRHKKLCSGRYEKVDDVSGFKNKGKSIGVQENVGNNHIDLSQHNRQARQRLLPAEEIKDKRVIKRPRFMDEYLTSISDKPKTLGPEIPRQRRTSCKKISNLSNVEANTNCKRRREITLVIQLLGVYTDEESEEDLEPLINKRSLRRKKMKQINDSDEKGEESTGLTPLEVISLD